MKQIVLLLATCLLVGAQNVPEPNSAPPPPLKLDPLLRRALLRALTQLELEAQRKATGGTGVDAHTSQSPPDDSGPVDEEQEANIKRDLEELLGNYENSFQEDNKEPVDDHKDEEEEQHDSAVFFRDEPEQPESPAPDIEPQEDVQSNVIPDKAEQDSNAVATDEKAAVKGNDLAPGEKLNVDDQEVSIFQAPLVAAFTLQQDEKGNPKSVVPLLLRPQPAPKNNAQLRQQQAQQFPQQQPQQFAQQQPQFPQQQQQQQQQQFSQQGTQQFSQQRPQQFIQQQSQQFPQQRPQQFPQHQTQQSQNFPQHQPQQFVQQQSQQFPQQQSQQFSQQQPQNFPQQQPQHFSQHLQQVSQQQNFQPPNHFSQQQPQHFRQQQGQTFSQHRFQIQPQGSVREEDLARRTRLLEQQLLLFQQQQQFQQQQNLLKQQEQLRQRQQQLFQQEQERLQRPQRQETGTGIVDFQQSVDLQVPQPQAFFRPSNSEAPQALNNQLQSLLYQSGVAGDLQGSGVSSQEDLNIVSKILSLNHEGRVRPGRETAVVQPPSRFITPPLL